MVTIILHRAMCSILLSPQRCHMGKYGHMNKMGSIAPSERCTVKCFKWSLLGLMMTWFAATISVLNSKMDNPKRGANKKVILLVTVVDIEVGGGTLRTMREMWHSGCMCLIRYLSLQQHSIQYCIVRLRQILGGLAIKLCHNRVSQNGLFSICVFVFLSSPFRFSLNVFVKKQIHKKADSRSALNLLSKNGFAQK